VDLACGLVAAARTLDRLGEAMLKLHKDLPKAKTPHEQESLKSIMAATDKEIDELVHELYGLTEQEIRIVEGGQK
jgi:hypothetical protein